MKNITPKSEKREIKCPKNLTHLTELKLFKEQYGHCNVPQKYSNNPSLGEWVSTQRRGYRKNTINQDLMEKLNEMNFSWFPKKEQQHKMLADLKLFKKKYGHCNVPQKFPENPSLGTWVTTRRQSYTKGKLDKDSINELNALGFSWSVSDALQQNMLADLKSFKKKHGHCNVPQNYPENQPLGYWTHQQRSKCNKNILTKTLENELNALEFTWDINTLKRQKKLEELKLFKEKHGHCNVPTIYRNNQALGTWVSNQRKKYKEGGLNKILIKDLNKLGFAWKLGGGRKTK